MARISVSKARESLPDLVAQATSARERTILSDQGKDVAAVVPIEDVELLERLSRQEMDRIDIAQARAALREARKKGTIPLRSLLREPGE